MNDYGAATRCGTADLDKDPDDIADVPFNWAAELDGDTIATSTFLLPDGMSETSTATDGSATSIRVSGGDCGSICRVTNRIVTTDGRQFDKTKRVLIREH